VFDGADMSFVPIGVGCPQRLQRSLGPSLSFSVRQKILCCCWGCGVVGKRRLSKRLFVSPQGCPSGVSNPSAYKNCFVRYTQERPRLEPRRFAVKCSFCSLEKNPNCPFTSGHARSRKRVAAGPGGVAAVRCSIRAACSAITVSRASSSCWRVSAPFLYRVTARRFSPSYRAKFRLFP